MVLKELFWYTEPTFRQLLASSPSCAGSDILLLLLVGRVINISNASKLTYIIVLIKVVCFLVRRTL